MTKKDFWPPFGPLLAHFRPKISGKIEKWIYANNSLRNDRIWMKLSGNDHFMIIRFMEHFVVVVVVAIVGCVKIGGPLD